MARAELSQREGVRGSSRRRSDGTPLMNTAPNPSDGHSGAKWRRELGHFVAASQSKLDLSCMKRTRTRPENHDPLRRGPLLGSTSRCPLNSPLASRHKARHRNGLDAAHANDSPDGLPALQRMNPEEPVSLRAKAGSHAHPDPFGKRVDVAGLVPADTPRRRWVFDPRRRVRESVGLQEGATTGSPSWRADSAIRMS